VRLDSSFQGHAVLLTSLSFAVVGGSILGVAGGYGYMMGKPYKVVGSEKSPMSITEQASEGVKKNP
jgi:hypothetical protein